MQINVFFFTNILRHIPKQTLNNGDATMTAALMILLGPAAGGARLFERATPVRPPRWAEKAALFAILLAVMAAMSLVAAGPVTSPVLGFGEVGLSVRIDAVSVILLLLSGVLA